MKRLADVLGFVDIVDALNIEPTTVIESSGVDNQTAQDFALSILQSTEYRQSLLRRITTDDLPPAVETKLMDYGWGKPKETIHHEHRVTRVVREIIDPSDITDQLDEDLKPTIN